MARPRKDNVYRDKNGKSRGEFIHPEAIAVRERQLEQDGIVLQFQRYEGLRKITRDTATDRLAGSSLGRLYLRWQQGERLNAISKEQYEAGEHWADLVRQYLSTVHGKRIDPKAASMEFGLRGRSCSQPLDETIEYLSDKFDECRERLERTYDRSYGNLCVESRRVVEVTWGICIQDWPLNYLHFDDYGKLKLGLNAVGKALDTRY